MHLTTKRIDSMIKGIPDIFYQECPVTAHALASFVGKIEWDCFSWKREARSTPHCVGHISELRSSKNSLGNPVDPKNSHRKSRFH